MYCVSGTRGFSFFEGDNLFPKKGTSRTVSQAEMVCVSWAWTWRESLTSEHRSVIQSSLAEPASKKKEAMTMFAAPGGEGKGLHVA